MKQTFTLLAALSTLSITVSGQIKETFENVTDLSFLSANLWQFSGVSLSSAGNLNGAKNLSVIPTTNITGPSQIATPYVNFAAGTKIKFAYKISNKLATESSRTIAVLMLDVTGRYDSVDSITLDRNTPVSILNFSGVSPVAGVKRLVIKITGKGDGNTYLFVDDLAINSTFNSNPYSNSATGITVLPLQLTNFQGSLAAEKIQLQWSVAQNENGDFFEIQKSFDGKVFTTAAFVAATLKQGNEAYNYKEAAKNSNYYRLKIINKDGSVAYSKVLLIKSQTERASTIALVQNPIQDDLSFSFVSSGSGTIDVAAYTVSGVKIYSEKMNVQKGKNSVSIALNSLSSGTYILEVRHNDERSTAKFIKM